MLPVLTPIADPGTHPAPFFKYQALDTKTVTLPKGHQLAPDKRALPCDLVFEQDSAVLLRDGAKIYTDVFRTPQDTKVPAIIHYGPYGKVRLVSSQIPVDPTMLTCPRGYAIVNTDARGSFHSEGNINWIGQQQAEDVYDLISWVVAQDWCNGSVTMAGNSQLSMTQTNHAARCPHPALKCIAPWEGAGDLYRETTVRGGMPWLADFNKLIVQGYVGFGKADNPNAAIATHPLFDKYWEDRCVPIDKIDIPLYALASYSTGLHTLGSVRIFREAMTERKWLRFHLTQEWHDLYSVAAQEDLQRFFDFYLKGISNGWETETPKVRLSLLSFSGSPAKPVENRPETSYPLARTQYTTLHLDARTKHLIPAIALVGNAGYDSESPTDTLDFAFNFEHYTELAGYSKVKLWIQCDSHSDMDVVVQLRKIDKNGDLLVNVNYPVPVPAAEVPAISPVLHYGPQGALRASHAGTLNLTRSTAMEPFYDHDKSTPILAGAIVPLEIGLWPWGAVFEAGEGIMLRISGHNMNTKELALLPDASPENHNKGRHIIHTGGEYDSHLCIPIV
ncbi:hypothetical protein RQP46_008254 [Phenoliferia psychrophenolica]